jgi:hypothetical protein
MITQLLTQASGVDTRNSSTQHDENGLQGPKMRNAETQILSNSSNFGQQADTAPTEIIKEVEKIVT